MANSVKSMLVLSELTQNSPKPPVLKYPGEQEIGVKQAYCLVKFDKKHFPSEQV